MPATTDQPEEPARYESIPTAMARFDISRDLIQTLLDNGSLRAYRLGPKSIRLRVGDLDAILQDYQPKAG